MSSDKLMRPSRHSSIRAYTPENRSSESTLPPPLKVGQQFGQRCVQSRLVGAACIALVPHNILQLQILDDNAFVQRLLPLIVLYALHHEVQHHSSQQDLLGNNHSNVSSTEVQAACSAKLSTPQHEHAIGWGVHACACKGKQRKGRKAMLECLCPSPGCQRSHQPIRGMVASACLTARHNTRAEGCVFLKHTLRRPVRRRPKQSSTYKCRHASEHSA